MYGAHCGYGDSIVSDDEHSLPKLLQGPATVFTRE